MNRLNYKKDKFIILSMFLAAVIALSSPVSAVDIPTDTSVGTWDPVTRTYTLISDVSGSLTIVEDNLTLDGAGHTVTGTGGCDGVYLLGRTGVAIKNLTVQKFYHGIYLYNSSNNNLTGNTVSANNSFGIYLYNCSGNTLIGNTASNNYTGIYIYSGCSNNTLTDNIANANTLDGIYLYDYCNENTLTGNTASNNSYGIYHESSSKNRFTGNNASNNYYGIYLNYSNNNTLIGNTTSNNSDRGITLARSSFNTLTDNTASNNHIGINLYEPSTYNNTLTGNTASNNTYGISLMYYPSSNVLTGNTASNNSYGIYLYFYPNNNLLTGNTASNNSYGIYLYSSSNNRFTGNNASNNGYGIYLLLYSNTNQVYNNNFISNSTQAYVSGCMGNIFNRRKPIGGNFWSNWTSPDSDGDGFVDNPYVFTGGQDNLPWAREGGWENQPPTSNAGSDQTVECACQTPGGTKVTLDGTGSSDPDNDTLTFTWTGPFAESPASGSNPTVTLDCVGEYVITLVVSDGQTTSTDTVIITVEDTTPPSVDAGPDIVAEQQSFEGAEVTLEGQASDNCDADLEYEWSEDGVVLGDSAALTHIFGPGTHTLTFKAMDNFSNVGEDSVVVEVKDTTAPAINSVSANPGVLWPPDHKMVEVTVTVDCADIGDPAPMCFIVGVTCNEVVNGPGDGNTEPDWDYTDDPLVVLLRAERAGSGSSRVYTIHINCVDSSGNTATATVDVTVPHDQGKGKK